MPFTTASRQLTAGGLLRGCVAVALTALIATGCGAAAPPAAAPATGEPPATPDQATICGAAVDVVTVIDDGPDIGDDPVTPAQVATAFNEFEARLEPPLTALERNPPAVLKTDIGTLSGQARYAIDNKDVTPLDTDEVQGAEGRVQGWVLQQCGYPSVRVVSTNYAYAGIPPTMDQGVVVFTLVNNGTEPHELDIFRIDDEVTTPVAELVKLPEAQRDEDLDEVADVGSDPESSDTVFATLTPGRYGVACLEPKGSTPDEEGTGPLHATLGEVAEFTVS